MNPTETTERKEQTAPFSELIRLTDPPPPPAPPIDFEEIGRQYLNDALRRTAVNRWNAYCPDRLKATDWQRPELAPYAAQHRIILDWQGGDRGLLAAGATGRGKSRAMWALMRTLSEQARDCRFFTASSLFAGLQAQVSYGRETAFDWLHHLSRVPIVFIDDLGQEAIAANRQDWAQGWLLQFLDMRLGNGLPLFVTTNLNAREMTSEPDQRIRADPLIRRLTELCEVVRF